MGGQAGALRRDQNAGRWERAESVERPTCGPEAKGIAVRRSMIAIAIAIAALLMATPAAALAGGSDQHRGHHRVATIVDSLAGVDTRTSFSVFGTAGQTFSSSVLLGPRFTLTERTSITEIGAYVNNCETILGGVPQCPERTPIVVQIHPAAVDGRPDMDVVLAQLELSDDGDPLLFSFERASMHLKLGRGTYFAMFAMAQPEDGTGTILSEATDPFSYLADTTVAGSFFGGNAYVVDTFRLAVRILGHPVHHRHC